MTPISYQPMPPEKTYFVSVRYYLRGRGEPLAYAVVCLCLMMLQGCIPILPGMGIDDQVKGMKANANIGCQYLHGEGKPPASSVEAGGVGCWGEMLDEVRLLLLEQLKGMK